MTIMMMMLMMSSTYIQLINSKAANFFLSE